MSSLAADGYEILDMASSARKAINLARSMLKETMGELCYYHTSVTDDQNEIQAAAGDRVRHVARVIVECHLTYFQSLLGQDIHITARPFFRLSRPGVTTDNIGFHRDTWYGDSPYELNVWIPLTDVDEGNGLWVAPGSHVWSDEDHPYETYERPDVEKGSLKHSLGFLYAPKRLKTPVEMIPLPMKVGQMLVFSLGLLHGQEVNRSKYTRMSLDARLVNSYAPILWERSRAKNYYEPLCSSVVSQIAKKYEAAKCLER
ncbi:MAG TPA: phytanoyl-CoA dioxygenase family protein [Candidatus Binatia bacterium]|nr:phytanoyl-CoA dioxygenase family protein [Candidatus Binatia bacterium]